MGGLHHVEIWVADAALARQEWDWLLGRLGWQRGADWEEGFTWVFGDAYLTFTGSPNLASSAHDRRRPGLNHLAFHGGAPSEVDQIMAEAPSHGWTPLYADRYPHAGGPGHHAGWLENASGFKAEIVASA
ncbi:MAG: VOC family protein [Microbacterium sp.]